MRRWNLLPSACAAAILCGLTVDATAHPSPSRSSDAERLAPSGDLREIGAALRASRRAPDAPTREFSDRIAATRALECMLDVLVEERVPSAEPGDAPQVLSAPQRVILLQALGGLPAASVRSAVSARLAAPGVDEARVALAAVRALGALGQARDIATAAALAPRKSGEAAELTRAGRESLRTAIETILSRDPAAYARVTDVVRTSDPATARPLVDAVAARTDPRALAVLYDAARTQPHLAPLCASAVLKVGRSLDADTETQFSAWLAAQLPGARAEYRRTLFQALGALDDGTHARLLVEGLSDEDPGARESALWALRRLSGFGFPGRPEPWTAWLDAEERWHAAQRPRQHEALLARDAARAAHALRAYVGRRLWRESLGTELVAVLQRDEPTLRVLGCEVVQSLGARSAIPALVDLLSAPEEEVRAAARRALTTITGLEIPVEPEAARAQLGLS